MLEARRRQAARLLRGQLPRQVAENRRVPKDARSKICAGMVRTIDTAIACYVRVNLVAIIISWILLLLAGDSAHFSMLTSDDCCSYYD